MDPIQGTTIPLQMAPIMHYQCQMLHQLPVMQDMNANIAEKASIGRAASRFILTATRERDLSSAHMRDVVDRSQYWATCAGTLVSTLRPAPPLHLERGIAAAVTALLVDHPPPIPNDSVM